MGLQIDPEVLCEMAAQPGTSAASEPPPAGDVTARRAITRQQDIPMVVAADAGMLSAANLKALDELELSFIVGSRMTKAPGDLGRR
ncbi:hypothetical protein [Mycobacterium riyadhense]|uniref:hypothetical protein n=1 Tax=Mycobacterium riyadhense TaxID=486698 RepID=UPI0019514937|nr:hypothetical protein [Mycobacterium riyadhense]